MRVQTLDLPEVLLIEPRVFEDERGFFFESYHASRYQDTGISGSFVQDNHARSAAGTLRGLHFQSQTPQGKLVRALRGAIFDVAVDIRVGSPDFGRWVGVELSESNRHQLWVPPGFAHGYCVTHAPAEVAYKCTALYDPDDQCGIAWDDADIGIRWPIEDPLLSAKDRELLPLAATRADLPVFAPTPDALG